MAMAFRVQHMLQQVLFWWMIFLLNGCAHWGIEAGPQWATIRAARQAGRTAWNRWGAQHHYWKGWRAGYYSLASGGDGTPPAVPPPAYWRPTSHPTRRQNQVDQWYCGFRAGLDAADRDGWRGAYSIPRESVGCTCTDGLAETGNDHLLHRRSESMTFYGATRENTPRDIAGTPFVHDMATSKSSSRIRSRPTINSGRPELRSAIVSPARPADIADWKESMTYPAPVVCQGGPKVFQRLYGVRPSRADDDEKLPAPREILAETITGSRALEAMP
jgi:hypothetical protein